MTGIIIVWVILAIIVFGFSLYAMDDTLRWPFPRSLAAAVVLGVIAPLVILALGTRTAIKLVREVW